MNPYAIGVHIHYLKLSLLAVIDNELDLNKWFLFEVERLGRFIYIVIVLGDSWRS